MNTEVTEFLKSQRVGVFSIQMMDGSPHGAALHFAHNDDPFVFIFKTDREYRKCEPLFGREESPATFVAGFEEGNNSKTIQVDGVAQVIQNDDELTKVYLDKFPEKSGNVSAPKVVFFKFTPSWWRFTDWSKPEGKTVYTSDGEVAVTPKKI